MAESNFTYIPSILMDRGYGTMSVLVQTVSQKADVELGTILSEFPKKDWSIWLSLLLPSSAQVVFCLFLMLVMALLIMLWFENKRITVLRKETVSVEAEYVKPTELKFQEFQIKVSEKRQRFCRTMDKISAARNRVQKEYVHLDNVKQLHDTVYEDLRYWKMTWINQTAKLRQINNEELDKLVMLQNSNRDKLEKQKQFAQGFIDETENRFGDIFHKVMCDKKAMNTIQREVNLLQNQLIYAPSLAAHGNSIAANKNELN